MQEYFTTLISVIGVIAMILGIIDFVRETENLRKRLWSSLIIVFGIILIIPLLINNLPTLFTQIGKNANANIILRTPSSSSNPTFTPRGTLTLDDPLHDNSKGYKWVEYEDNTYGSFCKFVNGAFHISLQLTFSSSTCDEKAQDFENFVYQVTMTIIKGDGGGGIVFREGFNGHQVTDYSFYVDQNGRYVFQVDDNAVKEGSTRAFKTGINQSNVLAVIANGNEFDFYVNNQFITVVSNIKYTKGTIGFIGETLNDAISTEVIFQNAKVWVI